MNYDFIINGFIWVASLAKHQNLRNDNLGFTPNHNSYGVISMDHDDALFSVKAVVSKASILKT